jgi:hypothetical protein
MKMAETVNAKARSLAREIRNGVRKGIRLIGGRYYYQWAKTNYIRNLEHSQRKFKETPVLVYQMGKVGSSTIVSSLKAIELNRAIYHLHFLTKERIAKTEEDRKEFFLTERYGYLKRPWLYEFLVKQLDDGLMDRKWKVITITREPVARNISTFFENLEVNRLDEIDSYEISSHYYKIPPTIIRLTDLEKLNKLFFERMNHDSPEQFFDREIKGVLGVDVYAHEFPRSKGYCILEDDVADILLLRLEDLNRVAREAFWEFLKLPDFILAKSNVGSEKNYALLYKEFKKQVNFPQDYLDRMYGSRYMHHFYSAGEIEKFKKKWLKTENLKE